MRGTRLATPQGIMRREHPHRLYEAQERVAVCPPPVQRELTDMLDDMTKWMLRAVVTGYSLYGAYVLIGGLIDK
jgi:hypothetical protein